MKKVAVIAMVLLLGLAILVSCGSSVVKEKKNEAHERDRKAEDHI